MTSGGGGAAPLELFDLFWAFMLMLAKSPFNIIRKSINVHGVPILEKTGKNQGMTGPPGPAQPGGQKVTSNPPRVTPVSQRGGGGAKSPENRMKCPKKPRQNHKNRSSWGPRQSLLCSSAVQCWFPKNNDSSFHARLSGMSCLHDTCGLVRRALTLMAATAGAANSISVGFISHTAHRGQNSQGARA